MKYDVWYLLELAESTGAVDNDKRYWCENVTFDAKDGWKVVIFYDQDEIDYIDSFITPDGTKVDFWEWKDCSDKKTLRCWRGSGDLIRLKMAAQEN
jgi:hypothetical protein